MEIRERVPALMSCVRGVFPLLRTRIMYWEKRLTGCSFLSRCVEMEADCAELEKVIKLFWSLFRSLKDIKPFSALLHVVLY